MKQRPSVKVLLQQFSTALDKLDFPDPVKSRTRGRLNQCIQEYLELPENRGRKRVRRDPMRRIRKTAKHLIHALRHARKHEDLNVRSRAKKLVRSLPHQSQFEEIECQASNFNGWLRKVGYRRNEKERKKNRFQFEVRRDINICQLNSIDQLRTAGRVLGLCVAHRDDLGREYHDRLRKKASEFYLVIASSQQRRTDRGRYKDETDHRHEGPSQHDAQAEA